MHHTRSLLIRATSVAIFFVLVLAAREHVAHACAVCATADPTLSIAGEEHPYRGRLRMTLDAREGRVSAGDVILDDRRIEVGVVWAPVRDFEISFAAPYLFRHIDDAIDHAQMGDVELRTQVLAYEVRGSFGRRRFGLLGALKLPTAPLGFDEHGKELSSALQPGCGSIAPSLGAFFSASRGEWSAYASGSLFLPFSIRDAPHASDSVRIAGHVQFQPHPRFAGRLGVFGRVDASGQLAGGIDDPNSGGFIGYATGEIVTSPIDDLVLTIGVFLPVIEAFRGTHHESAIGAFTIAYDF